MSSTINGKKPLSSKAKPAPLTYDDLFGNKLGVDPAIKKRIDEMDMDCRFISVKHLQDMGGFHDHGWRPIKMKEVCATMDEHTKQLGSDPEGYIRRGDLVLGVRSKERGRLHKTYLAQEAKARELKQIERVHKDELRQSLKETREQVVSGFDEGDDE